ncbi:MAG: TolC family protein [Betaproteobacteria bacterium]|nr:TolC family protein [Betaproteobacteria bacterium]
MRRLLFAILLLPLASLAVPQRPLTLAEAESLWVERNRELRLAETAVAGASADVSIAGQRPNPEISLNTLSISPSEGFGAGPLKDKKMDSILRVEQVVERGGKRDLRLRGAEARLAAARLELDAATRQQRATLHAAYYALHLAQDRQTIARETAALYERGAVAGRLRQKAGDISPVELTRLEIDQARATADVRQAEAEHVQAQQTLAYLIGAEAEAEGLVAADPWPGADDAPLAEATPDRRPEVEAAARRVAAAEAERDLAHTRKTRDLTVGFQLERNLQNAPTNSFGVGVSVPLFIWHEYEGDIARAEADLETARVQHAQLRALAAGRIAVARSALLAARDRLRRLAGSLLDDAERVARASELAYSKGAIGLTDLLDARRTLRQVRSDAAAARADYARALSDWQSQIDPRNTP